MVLRAMRCISLLSSANETPPALRLSAVCSRGRHSALSISRRPMLTIPATHPLPRPRLASMVLPQHARPRRLARHHPQRILSLHRPRHAAQADHQQVDGRRRVEAVRRVWRGGAAQVKGQKVAHSEVVAVVGATEALQFSFSPLGTKTSATRCRSPICVPTLLVVSGTLPGFGPPGRCPRQAQPRALSTGVLFSSRLTPLRAYSALIPVHAMAFVGRP